MFEKQLSKLDERNGESSALSDTFDAKHLYRKC